MLAGMAPEQLDELIALDQLEPIGPEVLYHILTYGFAALYNAWNPKTPKQPSDFLPPRFRQAATPPPRRTASARAQKALIANVVAAHRARLQGS